MDSELLRTMVGQVVVVDLASSYVCLGELVGLDEQFLQVKDADLHDFRDSAATREIYVFRVEAIWHQAEPGAGAGEIGGRGGDHAGWRTFWSVRTRNKQAGRHFVS